LKQYQELRPNEITKKLKKYNEIISENGLSFFIGVSIDLASGFDFEDFKEHFLGKTVEVIDYHKPEAKLEQFNHYGKIWTELGEFYNNLQLSGVIILYRENFHFLINPKNEQIIHQNKNQSIKEKLLSLNGLPNNDSLPSKLMYLNIVKE